MFCTYIDIFLRSPTVVSVDGIGKAACTYRNTTRCCTELDSGTTAGYYRAADSACSYAANTSSTICSKKRYDAATETTTDSKAATAAVIFRIVSNEARHHDWPDPTTCHDCRSGFRHVDPGIHAPIVNLFAETCKYGTAGVEQIRTV